MYLSPNIVKVIKSRKIKTMEEGRKAFKILSLGLGGDGKTRLEYIKEIGVNTSNCVDSTQDRNNRRALLNAALNIRLL